MHIRSIEDKYGIPIRFVESESANITINTKYSIHPVTDSTIEELEPLEQYIVELGLENSQVTDESLSKLSQMTQLEALNLRNTEIKGSNLELLNSLGYLKMLNLSENELLNGAIEALENHSSLTKIYYWQSES